MTYRVLVTDYAWPDLAIESALLDEVGAVSLDASKMTDEQMRELAPTVDAILTCWRTVDAATIEAATKCRVIARYGVGVDNIDVAAATRNRIPVTRVAEYCVDEVAEHTMGLLLASARKIVAFSRQTRAGEWDNKAAGPIHRVSGQTLGLIGFGRIAQAVATRAVAFGMNVVAYSSSRTGTVVGVRMVDSMGELLRVSDFVSIHVPLTPDTEGLLSKDEFESMKPTAYVINTSRGPVVDEAALGVALCDNVIGGAALDVLAVEPAAADHELRGLDNVILTPHAAFYSEESTVDLRRRATESAVNGILGRLGVADSVVNPHVVALT